MSRYSALLQYTRHRPWPLPSGPWIMEQGWYDLLFLHWPIPVAALEPLVPRQLPIDTFDGSAWLSVAPFHMRMRPRGASAAGLFWHFPELNCRTYVSYRGKPGICFFSLDAASLIAVLGARIAYRLPYFHSAMTFRKQNGSFLYASERLERPASFRARYAPQSPPQAATPGSLEYFLAERYCLYTLVGQKVFRGDIHHMPWPLQQASAEVEINTIGLAAGVRIEEPPALVQYARSLEVLIWPLRAA